MKLLTIEEIQQSQLETLVIFRDFCNRFGLKYYLASGTLLGAIRHQGFIPWDDDIDVCMPREDYDFLVEHFNDAFVNNRVLISKERCPEFYLNFAKIIDRNTVLVEQGQTLEIGVWIDIFPLDYLSDNKLLCCKANIIMRLSCFLAQYVSLKPLKRRPAYKNLIIRIINTLFPSEEWFNNLRLKQLNQIISPTKSNTFGLLYQNFGIYGVPMVSESLFEPSILWDFEKEMFTIPKEYDKLLKISYGKDYMNLPPDEERVSHHDFICYWREESEP